MRSASQAVIIINQNAYCSFYDEYKNHLRSHKDA